MYAYVGQAIGFYDAPMTEGHEDHFTNNKVVMTKENVRPAPTPGLLGTLAPTSW